MISDEVGLELHERATRGEQLSSVTARIQQAMAENQELRREVAALGSVGVSSVECGGGPR